jgi:hypothetical protein
MNHLAISLIFAYLYALGTHCTLLSVGAIFTPVQQLFFAIHSGLLPLD